MLNPRLEILPLAQQRLWPELAQVPEHFVLYGGTAIALRLGHRNSIDFDFFSDEPFVADSLYSRIGFLKEGQVIQAGQDTLSVIVVPEGEEFPVKISFFGGIKIGCVAPPSTTADNTIRVASAIDLLGTKLKVLLQRVESKDYYDIAELLLSGVSLNEGLGAASALYGPMFPASECLKALVYFQEGDLSTLADKHRKTLIESVRKFNGKISVVRKASESRLAVTAEGNTGQRRRNTGTASAGKKRSVARRRNRPAGGSRSGEGPGFKQD